MRTTYSVLASLVDIAALLSLSIGAIFLAAKIAESDDHVSDVTLDQIRDKWKQREIDTRSLRYTFTEQTTWIKGALLRHADLRHADRAKARSARPPDRSHEELVSFPQDDTTYETTYDLILDEQRVRLDKNGKAPSPDGPINQHDVYAFDGTTSKDYHPLGTPFGIIHKEKRTRALDYAAIKPILCAFRPFTSTETSLDESSSPVKVATGIIDGQQCFVMSRPASKQHEVAFEVWVDPSREFSIVRVSKRYNGTLVTQYDISYDEDPRYGWVPTSWKSSHWDQRSGKLKSSSRCEVTTYEINPRIAPSEFQLQFPPGTLVTDSRNSTDYIQRDNGKMRLITKAELARGATYEDFLKTESGAAASQPPWSRSN